jgi:predicted phosphodiesterase
MLKSKNLQHKTTIKQLSISSDKLLLFGGVYSNLQALEELKKIAESKGFLPQNIICTGDIVAYCAQPEECIQLIKEWGINCIIGNVEEQVRSGGNDCGCNFNEGSRCDAFSRQWFPFVQESLSEDSLQWLTTLPAFLQFPFGGKRVSVVHGSFSDISQFIFYSTPWEIKQAELEQSASDIIIAGHCGLPFSQKKGASWWINPGVIGMPANDGESLVWYAELSSGEHLQVQHHAFAYNHYLSQQLMREKQLPLSYAETLDSGIWDNCEVLPPEETALQGKKIPSNHFVTEK